MRSLIALPLLCLSVLAGAQTITFTSDCFTGAFSLDKTVNGRNQYIDDDGDSNTDPSLRIAYNPAATRWEVQVVNDPTTVFYATETNTFAPNPPDSAVTEWTGTNGCPGTAQVGGSGTQAVDGSEDLCQNEGGDSDDDGICDDNDQCPGGDDKDDPDGDGIPTDCDANPVDFDGLEVVSECFGSASPVKFLPVGKDTSGRNIYLNAPLKLMVAYNDSSTRWELRDSQVLTPQVYYSNTLSTRPNPPASTLEEWAAGVCGNTSVFSGTGTQTVVPTIECPPSPVELFVADNCLAAMPDLTVDIGTNLVNANITQSLPADTLLPPTAPFDITFRAEDSGGNFVECAVPLAIRDTLPPTVTVPFDTITVFLDELGTTMLTADAVNADLRDNCSEENLSVRFARLSDTSAADRIEASCDDLAAPMIPSVAIVTDSSGNTGRDTFILAVVDARPPVLVCNRDSLYLDSTGTGQYAIGDLVDIVSDNCPPARELGNPFVLFTREHTGLVTSLQVRTDSSGNSASCTVELLVIDTFSTTALDFWQADVDQQLEIYPNPTDGQFFVDHPTHALLELYDALGRRVWSGKPSLTATATLTTTEVKVDSAPGIYLLTAVTPDRGWRKWVTIK
ncbi:hypothetical protein GGR28_003600 [Lewinella aquimaris]|uniref:Uncharacterized protein n=1 Tax=Neolewinella aquimaris TaxID=1835722 RepID=A0A840EGL9_9BACT|nr:T9SS type A sorting domain-containing protein [Neolewinella aquimaris]MBB4080959.1 hypothetical protein [Neolewinella aquimaris]